MDSAGNDLFNRAALLFIVACVALIAILILFFASNQGGGYLALYISSNDISNSSITDRIDFSFIVENHFSSAKTTPFKVLLENNLITSGTLEIPANGSVEEKIVLPFKKSSFNQKKVVVTLPDENEEVYFNAGLTVNTTFDNNLALVSAQVTPAVVGSDRNMTLNYSWVALGKTDANYMVFVHFIDQDYALAFQYDHYPTVDGDTIMTSEWVPDTQLNESLDVQIPPNVPDGNYVMLVGLYIPGQNNNAPVKTKSGADYATMQQITLVTH